jgi:hypothetical protein
MGEGEMREILSTHPRGTSRVLLNTVKSYDMGPSRFTSHPRGKCAADFLSSLKIHLLGRGLNPQTNHYTTKATRQWLLQQKFPEST